MQAGQIVVRSGGYVSEIPLGFGFGAAAVSKVADWNLFFRWWWLVCSVLGLGAEGVVAIIYSVVVMEIDNEGEEEDMGWWYIENEFRKNREIKTKIKISREHPSANYAHHVGSWLGEKFKLSDFTWID